MSEDLLSERESWTSHVWAQGRWDHLAGAKSANSAVIGWALSTKPDAELVIKALDMAYEACGKAPRCCSVRMREANMPAFCFGKDSGAIGCKRARAAT